MVGRGIIAALLGALLVSACGDKESGRVDPADHAAFYLWAGVRPGPEVARASELYILDGEVRRNGERLVALHPQAPRLADKRLWLVVRTQTLEWNPAVRSVILRDLAHWAAASLVCKGYKSTSMPRPRTSMTMRRFSGNCGQCFRRATAFRSPG